VHSTTEKIAFRESGILVEEFPPHVD
jgi:hypothetical protein